MKHQNDESFTRLASYGLHELVILLVTIALPPLFDAYLVAGLHSTISYGALGMATNFLHTLVKLSEAIPIAAIAIIGKHNGSQNHLAAGKHFVDTLWAAVFLGLVQFVAIWFGAAAIYSWLGVPPAMALIGAPFLRLRSLSLFFTFILLTVLGFIRALKDTYTPMLITLFGAVIYMGSSAILVSGYGGAARCGIYGPAYASLIQCGVMLIAALWYIVRTPAHRPYLTGLIWHKPQLSALVAIMRSSLPAIIDKGALAFAYVWLSKMLATLGPVSIASFDIIKNLERSAIMPAAAFAQVATMLVSNHLGAQKEERARRTTMRLLLLTSIAVCAALGALIIYAPFLVKWISPSKEVTIFAVPLLRCLSCLVVFDFVQLVLAGALRGAGHATTVMWIRFVACILFFLPISYMLARSSFESTRLQFCLIYGAFYCSTAVMGVAFWRYLKKQH